MRIFLVSLLLILGQAASALGEPQLFTLTGEIYLLTKGQMDISLKRIPVVLYKCTPELEKTVLAKKQCFKSTVSEARAYNREIQLKIATSSQAEKIEMLGETSKYSGHMGELVKSITQCLMPPEGIEEALIEKTDRQGAFAFTALPAGKYFVFVYAQYMDQIPVWMEIVPLSKDRKIELTNDNAMIFHPKIYETDE